MYWHGQCWSGVRMRNISWGSSIIIGNLFKERLQCFITWLDPTPRIMNRLLKTWSKSWPPRLLFSQCQGSICTGHGLLLFCHRGRAKSQQGKERVISYASKTLNPGQRKYCRTRNELLSIVMFTRHYRHYLLCQKFMVWTDHASLAWLMLFKCSDGLISWWLQEMGQYDFSIVHWSGKKHSNADGLSRNTLEGYCECYVAGKDLSTLPCGGCEFYTLMHFHWKRYGDDVDDVVPLDFGRVIPEKSDIGIQSPGEVETQCLKQELELGPMGEQGSGERLSSRVINCNGYLWVWWGGGSWSLRAGICSRVINFNGYLWVRWDGCSWSLRAGICSRVINCNGYLWLWWGGCGWSLGAGITVGWLIAMDIFGYDGVVAVDHSEQGSAAGWLIAMDTFGYDGVVAVDHSEQGDLMGGVPWGISRCLDPVFWVGCLISAVMRLVQGSAVGHVNGSGIWMMGMIIQVCWYWC